MNRKQIIIYLISSIVVAVGIASYGHEHYIGICPPIDRDYCDVIAVPVFFILLIAASVFLVKLITRPEVFNSWEKFAIVYIPIAVILVAITPNSSGWMGSGFGRFDKEATVGLLVTIYVIVSLLIIIIKSKIDWKDKFKKIIQTFFNRKKMNS